MNASAHSPIAVLTDTNCDLQEPDLQGLPIYVLPLRINDGTTEYRDGIDITVDDVYVRQKKEDFKTSLPSAEDVSEILQRMKADGIRQVIVLLLSDALSSASNLLRLLALETEDLEIEVMDSRSASIGTGVLAWETARLILSGLSFEALKERVAELIRCTQVFFSLDTLEYLKRGGRIGRVTEFVGNLLQIRPVMSFDDNGVITVAAKVRGRRLVTRCLIDCVRKVASRFPGKPYNLVVCEGGVPEECDRLTEELKKALPDFRGLLRGKLDATLAVHLGPNLLGAGIQILEEPQAGAGGI